MTGLSLSPSLSKSLFCGVALGLVSAAGCRGESGADGGTAPAIADSQALVDRLIAESQKHAYQRRTSADHPLRRAEAAAAGLAGDLAEYNVWMAEIIARWARAGELEEAAYLADNLPSSGPAKAHLEIAGVLLQDGKKSPALTHLDKVQETLGQARGRKAQILRVQYAELLERAGRKEQAAQIAAGLDELARLELDARLQKLGLAEAMDLKQAEARLAACEDRGVDKVRGEFLLACAVQQLKAGRQAAGMELLREAGRMATRDGLPSAQHLLVDVARTAYAAGEFAEADKALRLYFEIIKQYADAADWKAPFAADALDVLRTREGKAADVKAWLAVLEAGVSKVFILDAPKSILALARVAEKTGGAGEGDRLALMAAKVGASNTHPRGRAAAQVQVCLFYTDAGREVPAAVLAVMNSQAEAAAH